ncbi:MAG: peptide chain release factor N(5)-glutamine methyltransferase [Kiritimatiellae bacterium]|nr:peptide chain release factor N(5)-glutamine methyltransferase [Kiritimatiellia bacterium]
MQSTTESPDRTLKRVLDAATGYLAGKGVEEPRLASELLAARLLRCKRLELVLKQDLVLEERLVEAMRRGIRRLAAGEPVQYVLGETEFMGHVFKVDSRALIPRPETELLVEEVLACKPLWATGRPRIVDVGTGCGCIVISLALARPQGVYAALDVSEKTLELARENALRLGVADRIGFFREELADFVEPGGVDAIVANLPYIPTAHIEKLPVHIREHEPRWALDGGPDGLLHISTLIGDATIALKPGGFLFLEIGHDQAERVHTLMHEGGFEQIVVTKDYAGHDRIVKGVLGKLE